MCPQASVVRALLCKGRKGSSSTGKRGKRSRGTYRTRHRKISNRFESLRIVSNFSKRFGNLKKVPITMGTARLPGSRHADSAVRATVRRSNRILPIAFCAHHAALLIAHSARLRTEKVYALAGCLPKAITKGSGYRAPVSTCRQQ